MIRVSLTRFIDFVNLTGQPRLTFVQREKHRGPYAPKSDYYKSLREAIELFHKVEDRDFGNLVRVAAAHSAAHAGKSNFKAKVRGYKRFVSGKHIERLESVRAEWHSHDLRVTVNPELYLKINGVPTVVKLYFRNERLLKKNADIGLWLMREALQDMCLPDTSFAILDVEAGRAHYCSSLPVQNLGALLKGEAAAYAAIWNDMD